ncbi:hypothetical protein BU23DRAFT_183659 [Bimuria novae-zelandiae CBS 107.79]|uniref:SWIM-type domain-containing protein n=1 Tax=Bimuria novae-zelandiae CBS 107.79 TaxID=1447943 RepID=A0A6A5V3P2_9PLEO|nr:hypothetical protein BU23DRAFT_183659 [Bimuria novae-zelandiae CBS 107.79]
MSAEQLSKLSLSDMVTTRAGSRTGPPQTPPQDSPTSSPVSPTPSIIESVNGHRYDVSTFDDELRRRAKIGLVKEDNNIRMRFCGEADDGQKYFFHLEDDITVKLEVERVPKCSCGVAQNRGACKHIFWMCGQLSSVLPTDETIPLAQDGSTVRNAHPASVLKSKGLDQFAEHLHWVIEDDLPEDDELADEIANMLSVFEPSGALPAEFKSEDTRELSVESRMYREFKTILLEQAVQCPAFYLRLTRLITSEFQVKRFFAEINKRIDRAFKALDVYIETGPTNRPSEGLDVVNCALRLNRLVQAIEEYRNESLESDAGERRDDELVEKLAGAVLIRILDEVTRRNYNAYANATWGVPSTNPRENNLFVCLIGPASEDQGLFVLDSLQDMAPNVIRHHSVDLGDIEVVLRNTPLTPPAYLNAFRTLLQDSRKRAASQSAGSSAKRPMQ